MSPAEPTPDSAGGALPQRLPVSPGGGSALRISVVIPTFRRPQLLLRCLEALLRQRFDPAAFEVIVVDDGHTADTQTTVDAMALRSLGKHTIRYLRPETGHGPAVARNCGWRRAHAAIVAFTDDDTIPDPDWLAEGERALQGRVVAVSGQVRVPLDGQTARLDEGMLQPAPEGKLHEAPRDGRRDPHRSPHDDRRAAAGAARRPTDHELMTLGLASAEFVTANAFVRRSALFSVGGFDERFERAWREDSDLQFKLIEDDATIARCPAAVVTHPVRAERWGVSLRQQKNVFYDALLFKKHPRLYRERILATPPWNYYLIVVLSIAAVAFTALDIPGSAFASALLAAGLILAFAFRRLRNTSLAPAHVAEMIVTSAAIPFLSVYWRLRGAIHFRVAYF